MAENMSMFSGDPWDLLKAAAAVRTAIYALTELGNYESLHLYMGYECE